MGCRHCAELRAGQLSTKGSALPCPFNFHPVCFTALQVSSANRSGSADPSHAALLCRRPNPFACRSISVRQLQVKMRTLVSITVSACKSGARIQLYVAERRSLTLFTCHNTLTNMFLTCIGVCQHHHGLLPELLSHCRCDVLQKRHLPKVWPGSIQPVSCWK